MNAHNILVKAKEHNIKYLGELEAKEILRNCGVSIIEGEVAKTPEHALSIAKKIGFPVVLKVVSPQILHKSDVGGVKVNIIDENKLISSYQEILRNVSIKKPDCEVLGIYVQKQGDASGCEVIIGATRDPTFDHVLVFGLGGIFVEVLKDLSYRIVPVDEKDATEMVKEIKGYPILKGLRGEGPLDINSIIQLIVKVSNLIVENGEYISEMDINPILLLKKGYYVLDARFVLL